jgi:hypothetical protein
MKTVAGTAIAAVALYLMAARNVPTLILLVLFLILVVCGVTLWAGHMHSEHLNRKASK